MCVMCAASQGGHKGRAASGRSCAAAYPVQDDVVAFYNLHMLGKLVAEVRAIPYF